MKTVNDLKVGDTVWHDDVNRKGLFETKVTKIGSKLVHTSSYVFRKDSMRTNDGYSHQCLIPDLERYQESQECRTVWRQIVQSSYGADVSLADMKQAAALLKIKLD